MQSIPSKPDSPSESTSNKRRWRRTMYWGGMSSFGLVYLVLIAAMILADLQFVSIRDVRSSLADERIQYSFLLSFLSCSVSSLLATICAVPTGYVLARSRSSMLRGRVRSSGAFEVGLRRVFEIMFDVPLVLPPLVVGVSLLLLFQTPPGRWVDHQFGELMTWLGFSGIRGVSFEIPAIVLAQFTVSAALAIRVMRATFEQIDPEQEAIALVLGANRFEAFSYVALPQAWHGIFNAASIAWARALGEFGPILIFAGTARFKTEVLSTTVYLNFSSGNLRGAVTASILMLVLASAVLLVIQWLGAMRRH